MTLEGVRVGQVALVTGGSQGIGFAVAHQLASSGMSVAVIARDQTRLDAAVTRLQQDCAGEVTGFAADVADEASITRAVSAVVSRFGGIHVLVTSAGTSMRARRPLVETSTEEWMRLLDANLTGTYLSVRTVLAHMECAGSGFVITIQSTASFHAGSGGGIYAATKFGVRALTESLIDEYRGTGIRISSISPGPVDTSIWDLKAAPPTPLERARMLRPNDVAETVMWLLSRPAHMHVQDITVTPWVATSAPARTIGPDQREQQLSPQLPAEGRI